MFEITIPPAEIVPDCGETATNLSQQYILRHRRLRIMRMLTNMTKSQASEKKSINNVDNYSHSSACLNLNKVNKISIGELLSEHITHDKCGCHVNPQSLQFYLYNS